MAKASPLSGRPHPKAGLKITTFKGCRKNCECSGNGSFPLVLRAFSCKLPQNPLEVVEYPLSKEMKWSLRWEETERDKGRVMPASL